MSANKITYRAKVLGSNVSLIRFQDGKQLAEKALKFKDGVFGLVNHINSHGIKIENPQEIPAFYRAMIKT